MALRAGQLEERFGIWDVVDAPTRELSLDFETYCDLNLKTVGLDLYSAHPSCSVLMAAYKIDGGETKHWDATRDPMPKDLKRALNDPDFMVWAFNAQFERMILWRVLKIMVPIERFRCTMVLAYMHSFFGGLEQITRQCGMPDDKQKLATGKKLMGMFSWPQKITRNQPLRRFTSETHPVEWEMFCEYNIRDVDSEYALKRRLHRKKYSIPEREWHFYALDQIINDRGLPIDRLFVRRALDMAVRRKAQLLGRMNRITGLENSGSRDQLLPWLNKRGYPFDDLRKDSVKKTLTAWAGIQSGELKHKRGELYPDKLTSQAVKILKLRLQQNRTTPTKYSALIKAMGDDNRMRFVFQFAGASRTARFAGRRFQPQNLTTLRLGGDESKHEAILMQLTEAIRDDDEEALSLYVKEPMDALAGLVRSSVRAKKGKVLLVCDLSSIESVVIGWVTGCERLLNVFREGRDAYKDFATELFKCSYEEVTSYMRKMAKPATLGAGYRLGGGEIQDGKRTGLWGYAENMGVDMTRKDSHKGVATFRRVYKEIPQTWYALEDAIIKTIKTHRVTKVGPIKFSYEKPYLVCHLPSGRNIYYLQPRVERKPFTFKDRETGEKKTIIKDSISYMGKTQNGSSWRRIYSHGGKFIENIVQAIARDILREGLMLAHAMGFTVVGHVHDEIICEEKIGSKNHTLAALRECMIAAIAWAVGLPLNAAGHQGKIYRKD